MEVRTEPMVLINHVKRAACAVYGIDEDDFARSSRRELFYHERFVAAAVAHHVTLQSPALVARAFGFSDSAIITNAAGQLLNGFRRDSDAVKLAVEIERLARRYAAGDWAAMPEFCMGPNGSHKSRGVLAA